MKIFIVEDDKELNNSITSNLEMLGYNVVTFTDGQHAIDNINHSYNFFLIDITIPNVNGLEILKHIKLLNISSKIFIMSADTNIHTILNAYDLGADDYIKKPFDLREVVAKIQNIKHSANKDITICKDCTYNFHSKILFFKNREVLLTNKEKLLLEILLIKVSKIVSNEEIESFVWGEIVGSAHVRQLVSKLRKSLPYDIINNHVGHGYKLEPHSNY